MDSQSNENEIKFFEKTYGTVSFISNKITAERRAFKPLPFSAAKNFIESFLLKVFFKGMTSGATLSFKINVSVVVMTFGDNLTSRESAW